MVSESDSTFHFDVHHVVDSDNGDDMGSKESQILEPSVLHLMKDLTERLLHGIV